MSCQQNKCFKFLSCHVHTDTHKHINTVRETAAKLKPGKSKSDILSVLNLFSHLLTCADARIYLWDWYESWSCLDPTFFGLFVLIICTLNHLNGYSEQRKSGLENPKRYTWSWSTHLYLRSHEPLDETDWYSLAIDMFSLRINYVSLYTSSVSLSSHFLPLSWSFHPSIFAVIASNRLYD